MRTVPVRSRCRRPCLGWTHPHDDVGIPRARTRVRTTRHHTEVSPCPPPSPSSRPPRPARPSSARTIERRDVGPNDVQIDIAFAGVCHSDIHQAREEWGKAIFPMVPGHEIAGVVTAGRLRRHQAQGRRPRRRRLLRRLAAASARTASPARSSSASRATCATYNGRQYSGEDDLRRLREADRRRRELRAVASPRASTLDERRAAALRRHHDLLAPEALGCRPRQEGRRRRHGRPRPHGRARSRTPWAPRSPCSARRFQAGGRPKLGADHYYAIERPRDVQEAAQLVRPDHQHGLGRHGHRRLRSALSRLNGTHGLRRRCPRTRSRSAPFSLIGGRRSLAGSNIGGIRETQEMLDFCAEHGIGADDRDDLAPTRSTRPTSASSTSEVRYRFVIDTATI